jgi:hypothetical protein
MQRGAKLARVAVELGLEHRAHLLGVEGEVGAPELEDLALSAQAIDRERGLGPRGEHEVQRRGRLAAERLDRAHRRAVGRQRVEVVEDQCERPPQALLQRLRQRRREGVGAGALVGARVGAARGAGRCRQVHGQVGNAQAQRVDEAATERRERASSPKRVPGHVVALEPAARSVDLPKPAPAMTVVRRRCSLLGAPLQLGARERRRRDRCGQDLGPERHRAHRAFNLAGRHTDSQWEGAR